MIFKRVMRKLYLQEIKSIPFALKIANYGLLMVILHL
jgi:hypothetical protein